MFPLVTVLDKLDLWNLNHRRPSATRTVGPTGVSLMDGTGNSAARSSKSKKLAAALPTDAALPDVPILNAVQAAIIITDGAGIITYWNSFAEQLYGWVSREVVGSNIMSITVSAATAAEAEEHMACLRTGGAWSGEFEVRCKSGALLPALVTLSPMRDEHGTTVRIIGVSQDLSGRKRIERELEIARAELEKRVEERTAELKKANDSLRDLSARLLQLRDQESRRLARELHDSVGQMLAAISINIAAVQSQAHKLDAMGARAVAENSNLVQQIISEIRTISHLLHPPLLDEVGLSSALDWYVDGFAARSKIKVKLDIASDLGRLSAEMETTIFRIVQECLTNIHRHSESKTATIRLFRDGKFVIVKAEDAGKGIPHEKSPLTYPGRAGVGFRGLVERIRYLGGQLEIQSSSTGTAVTATLPLECPAPAAQSEAA